MGDTVLDPFAGSGTTLKVARELGRNSIGFEINPTFEDLIREKLGVNEKETDDSFEFIMGKSQK
jgi:site-specific DNA-methyltransferase (adenine-specific)